MAGLKRFKADLDLLASNCRQFWEPELEYANLQLLANAEGEVWTAVNIREFLDHADQFQQHVDEKFNAGQNRVLSALNGHY